MFIRLPNKDFLYSLHCSCHGDYIKIKYSQLNPKTYIVSSIHGFYCISILMRQGILEKKLEKTLLMCINA